MTKGVEHVKGLLSQNTIQDPKGGADTLKMWEAYKNQALLWRAIALLQIPATLCSILIALYALTTHSITLKVPARPLPGVYAVQEIPDTEFINAASEFINLTQSYQSKVARRQYTEVLNHLAEPFLTEFQRDYFDLELKAIESTARTQVFLLDPTKTEVSREDRNSIKVTFIGERLKFIMGQEQRTVTTKFSVYLNTYPRNSINPYGIMISGFSADEVVG